MKVFKLIALIALFTSCTTVTLQHEGTLKDSNGKLKKFTYLKGYGTERMPVYCGISAIFYGGYCWNYLAMPELDQKKALLNDSTSALDKKLGKGKYQIIEDSVDRRSWNNRVARLDITNYGDHIYTETESSRLEMEMDKIEKNYLGYNIGMIFRYRGTGVEVDKHLSDKFSLGAFYIDQGQSTGRRIDGDDDIKGASDFGLSVNWHFDQVVNKTGFYLNSRAIYSLRDTYSKEEDIEEEMSRPKNKEALYLEASLGIRYMIYSGLNLNFQYGKGVEVYGRKTSKSNYNTFEALIGCTF